MIFEINMEYFRRKARLVAGGHVTETPAAITYVRVVQRNTVIIALILDELNELRVKVADIQNAYITVPVTQKIWTLLGQYFGEDYGRKAIVVWDIYALKSEGAAFQNYLLDCMNHLRFLPCPSDLDLWMKPMLQSEDGFEYYM